MIIPTKEWKIEKRRAKTSLSKKMKVNRTHVAQLSSPRTLTASAIGVGCCRRREKSEDGPEGQAKTETGGTESAETNKLKKEKKKRKRSERTKKQETRKKKEKEEQKPRQTLEEKLKKQRKKKSWRQNTGTN